jgi:hypothetical protein
MAYLTHLVAVPPMQLAALRTNDAAVLTPSLAVGVSHLIAYWVQAQPLGQLLGQAIDGGTLINKALRHPLRAPCFHEPEAVQSLHVQLVEAWRQGMAAVPIIEDDWYRIEIEKVLRLFRHAVERGECVVSALEPLSIRFANPT